jgi:hypothetical protein
MDSGETMFVGEKTILFIVRQQFDICESLLHVHTTFSSAQRPTFNTS